nr:response regulator [Gemmatimonadota bacterium]NIR80851.1 response regulator [Gemmatimonadota bacterium]NIT89670.1 response regulator [Gemmatimonadota bacterium]NIU33450.1 response regulator [Gemmatimonadota bacterium]NIU37736.1 response regulator [Gemmatimonadota bacterium]
MPDPAPSPAHRGRVLVADDEPHIRRILITLLKSASFQVDVVSDGAAALTRLLGRRRYDLVLLDIVMPRASGLEVLERVRDLEHRRDVPIVILTAKGQDVDRDQAFALGASEFVTKPFSPKKLLARIDELLEQP